MKISWIKHLYDKTIRKAPGVHAVVKFFAWHGIGLLVQLMEKLEGFELPPDDIAPWFKLPWVLCTFEREVIQVYRQFLSPGMVVADVGAHAGYHTIRFAHLVGPNGKVYAFEPAPQNFKVLTRNVRRKRLTNVVVEPICVADYSGECSFFLFSEGSASHSLVAYSEKQYSVTVPCTSLDDYFLKRGIYPDLVKIDVEGAEPLVLKGMKALLFANRNITLIMEFYPQLIRRLGFSPIEHLLTLYAAGFNLFEISREGKIKPIPENSLEDFTNSVQKLTNILARRPS